jgi:hypothetical protein
MELALFSEKFVLLFYQIIRHHIREHRNVDTNCHKLRIFCVLEHQAC